jgi:hypothetical protein
MLAEIVLIEERERADAASGHVMSRQGGAESLEERGRAALPGPGIVVAVEKCALLRHLESRALAARL